MRVRPDTTASIFALAGLALVACDGGSGADAGPAMDAGLAVDAAAPDAAVTDAGTSNDAGAVDAGDVADAAMGSGCYMESRALLAAGDTVEVDQPACSPQDIEDVYACMYGGGGGSECEDEFGIGLAPDPSAPKWDCTRCLVAFDLSGPAPVVNQGQSHGFPNLYACQAAVEGRTACAIPVSRRVFCAQTACESCVGDAAAFDACRLEARAGICQDVEVPVDCEDLLDTETFASECQGSDFMETFMRMGDYFCGGPMRGG